MGIPSEVSLGHTGGTHKHQVPRKQSIGGVLTAPSLCPTGAASLEQLMGGAGGFCNVCQIIITYFDNELLKNETLAELSDILEKGCELLPTPFTGKVSWRGSTQLGSDPPAPHG